MILNSVTEQDATKSPTESVVYQLDVNNNIIAVNQSWQSFALANNAPELSADLIIGKPLMQYISGNITKLFWQTFLKKARVAQDVLQLEYRCDSPDLRRFMRIKVYKGNDEVLLFESTLLREESRPVSIHFKRAQQRGADTKIRCSFCNNILYKNIWVEVESFITSKYSMTLDVIYGICPACQSTLDAL